LDFIDGGNGHIYFGFFFFLITLPRIFNICDGIGGFGMGGKNGTRVLVKTAAAD
jgi:hypothetical protein